jgi:uncharacterized protein
MIALRKVFLVVLAGIAVAFAHAADTTGHPVKFRVVAIAEPGPGDHSAFVAAARKWLDQLAAENDFAVDYIPNTDQINDVFLAKYKLFIQLNYPPYRWTPVAKKAFERYITRGTGGWIGFHHAMLLGDFDGYPMWPWWSHFMGDIRYTSYVAQFATATVKVDDPSHPVFKGLPPSFVVQHEEWYTWSRSNRENVHVLATVDESTYDPKTLITMGDHPVVWTNPHVKSRNVYIFMGHHADLLEDKNFTQIFRNAIFWGAGQ